MTFEEAIKNLEVIVQKLEGNEIPLDEAIKSYEESQKLIKECEKQLSTAEKKIKKLVKNDKSETEANDFQLELI